MAVISRPGKEGNATTYQGKVAAGYTAILAQEVDADFDAIYAAWNAGVDTINIKDLSVTTAKIAPGAVTQAQLSGPITPSSAASGDLSGTYPNPTVVGVAGGILQLTPRAELVADGSRIEMQGNPQASVSYDATKPSWLVCGDYAADEFSLYRAPAGTTTFVKIFSVKSGLLFLNPRAEFVADGSVLQLQGNSQASGSYDSTKPTWLLSVDYTADQLAVYRAPANSTTFAQPLYVNGSDGKLYATLADGSVGRTPLGVNAIYGSNSTQNCPNGFGWSSASTWGNYMTLPALTTRGGLVFLQAQHNLSCSGPVVGGIVAQRWLRNDGHTTTPLSTRANLVATGSGLFSPMPGLSEFDNPPAGTYTYSMQVWTDPNCSILATQSNQGFLQAIEIG